MKNKLNYFVVLASHGVNGVHRRIKPLILELEICNRFLKKTLSVIDKVAWIVQKLMNERNLKRAKGATKPFTTTPCH